MKDPESLKRNLSFLCLIWFLNAVAFGLIFPVLPNLISDLSDLSNSQAAVFAGYLFFTYAMLQFLCAPIVGGLSDHFGRRPLLIITLLSFSCDYFIMAAAPNLTWLIIGKILTGALGATYAIVNACIADMTTHENRARAYGWVGAAVGLGFVIGPAIGGVLGEYNTRAPFIASGIIVLLACVIAFLKFEETLATDKRRGFSWKRANPIGSVIRIAKYPIVFKILVALFLLQLANQSYTSIWAFFTIEVVQWSPVMIGLSLGFYGLVHAFVQGVLTGPMVKRLGEIRMAMFSYIPGVLVFIGLAFASNSYQIFGLIFAGGFVAFLFPITQSLLTRNTPEDEQGELQGAVTSSYSLAAIIGPLIMSQLFGFYTEGSDIYFPGAPFICSSILILLSAAIFISSVRNKL